MESSHAFSIIRITGDSATPEPDELAIEEPLEIRLAFQHRLQNLAVTMRTPGNDADLALGFLFTEGIIRDPGEIATVEQVAETCSEDKHNTILVTLKEGVTPNLQKADRNFYTTSSCGVCGKASIGAIKTVSQFAPQTGHSDPLEPKFILGLPDKLAKAQKVFATTGGLHAAALFEDTTEPTLVREDVGRHNAVDKLIGAALITGQLPLEKSILLLSGRASFELVQKAAMAGIPVIAAVGAPSTLAVSLAMEFGITLIGFLRNHRFNIYTGAHRILIPAPENTLV